MQWGFTRGGQGTSKCSVQLERVPCGYDITLYYCAQNMYTYVFSMDAC